MSNRWDRALNEVYYEYALNVRTLSQPDIALVEGKCGSNPYGVRFYNEST